MRKWYACTDIHCDDWYPTRIFNFFGLLFNSFGMVVIGPFETKEEALEECSLQNKLSYRK